MPLRGDTTMTFPIKTELQLLKAQAERIKYDIDAMLKRLEELLKND